MTEEPYLQGLGLRATSSAPAGAACEIRHQWGRKWLAAQALSNRKASRATAVA